MLLTSDKVVDTAFLVRFRRPSLRMWSWWRRWRLWSASWMACPQHSRSQRWVLGHVCFTGLDEAWGVAVKGVSASPVPSIGMQLLTAEVHPHGAGQWS